MAPLNFRNNDIIPIRQESVQHFFQALCFGQLLFRHVTGVVPPVIVDLHKVGVGLIDGGWSDIVTPSPQLYLLLTVVQRHLSPVQANQSAVVTFVQPPRLGDGHPLLAHGLQHEPRCLNGAAENGGENTAKLVAMLLQQSAALLSLLDSVLTQLLVNPAAETVLFVPRSFTMTQKEEFVLRHQGDREREPERVKRLTHIKKVAGRNRLARHQYKVLFSDYLMPTNVLWWFEIFLCVTKSNSTISGYKINTMNGMKRPGWGLGLSSF